MSLTPESFDRLLADKLAQVPEPDYNPAHWDQLEDQLQHLNHGVQQAQPSTSPTPPPAPAPLAGSWLTGSLAKLGFAAALTGLTAVNGYFYLANQSQPTAGNAPATVTAPSAEPAAIQPAAPFTAPAVTNAPTTSAVSATGTLARTERKSSSHPAVPTAPLSANQPAAASPAPTSDVLPTGPAGSGGDAGNAGEEPLAANTSVVGGSRAAQPANAGANHAARTTAPAASASRPDSVRAARQPAADETTALNRLTLSAPNIITPNGDDLNDRFELPLPTGTFRLTVYDRRGHEVYKNEHYDNSWDAAGQPAGTYFYTVDTPGPPAWHASGSITVER